MKIIKPSFEILSPANVIDGVRMLYHIESMARISHRSEDKQTPETWKRFIPAVVMQHGDWSVVEHASATVLFRMDRGIVFELVRHRLFSFTQESTRFVNGRKSYPDGLEFIQPENLRNNPSQWHWEQACRQAETEYLDMLEQGIRPQEARSVLPNSLAATIAVTGNLRNWRHLLIMRTTQETHPDFKVITLPLLEEFKQRVPLLFDDIIPNQKQSEALSKPR